MIKRSGKSLQEEYINHSNSNILESVKNQNITENGFFVEKAEIEIISQEEKEKYLASIKFEKPDKYLISIKSRSGIEGARIYISDDTILVNDRIHKKLYSGNSLYIKRKFGVAQGLMPLIFGDLILDKNYEESKERCIGNILKMECSVKGVILDYEIDCNRKKVVLVNLSDNYSNNIIRVSFSNFINAGSNLIGRIFEFEDSQIKTVVKIKILKVELPWYGNIKFIPGKGYELIELV